MTSALHGAFAAIVAAAFLIGLAAWVQVYAADQSPTNSVGESM